MSSVDEAPEGVNPPVCEFCGMPIEIEEQRCAARDEGVCARPGGTLAGGGSRSRLTLPHVRCLGNSGDWRRMSEIETDIEWVPPHVPKEPWG